MLDRSNTINQLKKNTRRQSCVKMTNIYYYLLDIKHLLIGLYNAGLNIR